MLGAATGGWELFKRDSQTPVGLLNGDEENLGVELLIKAARVVGNLAESAAVGNQAQATLEIGRVVGNSS